MTNRTGKLSGTAVLLASALVLGACGGGDNEYGETTTEDAGAIGTTPATMDTVGHDTTHRDTTYRNP